MKTAKDLINEHAVYQQQSTDFQNKYAEYEKRLPPLNNKQAPLEQQKTALLNQYNINHQVMVQNNNQYYTILPQQLNDLNNQKGNIIMRGLQGYLINLTKQSLVNRNLDIHYAQNSLNQQINNCSAQIGLICQEKNKIYQEQKLLLQKIDITKNAIEKNKKSMIQKTTELKQKTLNTEKQVNDLQLEIDSFSIIDTIGALNAKQKSHILQKVWGKSDPDSTEIIDAIKQCGFDPHYINKQGQSLVELALNNNDTELFDLLIKNKINFGYSINKTIIAKLVLDSGYDSFIKEMFASEQNFSKLMLDIILNDDVTSLTKIISHKVVISKMSYSGYSLLQLALKNNSYKVAEKILQTDPCGIMGVDGESTLKIALMLGNKNGIGLLEKYGTNLKLELAKAISQDQEKIVSSILEYNPRLVNELDNQGNSPLYWALLQNKLEIAKLLLPVSDLMAVTKLASDQDKSDIVMKLIKLEPSLLIKLAQTENNAVTMKLLSDQQFILMEDEIGNNLLQLAYLNNNFQLVSLLLKKNPLMVDHQNNLGKTLFHLLLESSLPFKEKEQLSEEILKYHRPNIGLSDNDGHNLIECAREYDARIVNMFIEQGLIGEDAYQV